MKFKRILLSLIAGIMPVILFSQTIVFQEDFEITPLDLTSSGTTTWARSSTLQASGTYSDTAVVGLMGTSYLTSNSFSTVGNYMILLDFDQICKVELFDGGQIEYSINAGASWTALTTSQYMGSGTMTSNKFTANSYPSTWQATTPAAIPTNSWWKHETFDLSALVSNQPDVRIRFKLTDGNNNGPNQNYGWLLDNIEVSMAVSETNPPIISLIAPYPVDTAYNTGPFTVKAIISDASGIDTAIMVYTLNNGAPDTVAMTLLSGTNYQGVIPTAQLLDTICYYIHASDLSLTHNASSYPVSGCIQFIIKESPPPIGCITPITTFPLIENCETFTSGAPGVMTNGWTTTPASGFRWEIGATTSSTSTGPNYDHTTGTGKFIFTEASTGANGDSAFVFSPCVDLTAISNPALKFYYHMYGSTMGELHVDIWYGNEWVEDIMPAISGQQQTAETSPWTEVVIDLTPYKSVSQIRFRSYRGSNYYSDLSLDDISIFDYPQYDAAAVELTSPSSPGNPGNQAVTARIINKGIQNLTTANIGWSIDGVLQAPYVWSGNLALNDTSTVISLGNYTFAQGIYNVEIWTSDPNGNIDQYPDNDTLTESVAICGSGLTGTYTIDPSGGDYNNFTEAVQMLTTCGLTGPVVFMVAPGTYNEQITIPSITGSSATNTVTFQASTGINTDVILQHAATSTANGTVRLTGADYIIFNKLSIKTLGSTYSQVVSINGASTNITVDSCILIGFAPSASSSVNNSVFYSSGDLDNYLTFSNNMVSGGSSGVYLRGTGTATKEVGNIIINNTISNASYYGIYGYYMQDMTIQGNTITSATGSQAYSTVYGIYLSYTDSSKVFGNKVFSNGTSTNYGVYMYYCDGGIGIPLEVYNNFVTAGFTGGTGTTYGLYISTNTYLNLRYNSINILNNATTSRGVYTTGGSNLVFTNNNIANTGGGYAIYIGTTSALTASNYNNLFTSGPSLGYWAAARADLAAWQSFSSLDANSVSVYPGFAGNSDLHTNQISLNATATPIAGITTDIDGNVRNASTPDIGADEFNPSANDGIIAQMVAPANICAGAPEAVIIKLINNGSTNLSSALIDWEVNGVAQPQASFSGSLAQFASSNFQVGTYTFANNTPYDFKFYISSVNGGIDENHMNDTLEFIGFKTSLNGTYTIGATGDYPSISAAVSELMTLGVCGPVVFEIESGTYDEQVAIGPITGTSAINTVTFRSSTLNANDVVFSYAATGTSDNYVIQFNGCSYVTIEYLTLQALGSSYARVIDIMNLSSNNTIKNNVLKGITSTGTTNAYAVVYNASGLEPNNTIEGNTILNGSYGIYWYGSGTTSLERGGKIINNVVSNFYYYGIYGYYQSKVNISGNIVSNLSGTTYSTLYGLYAGYCDSSIVISNNKVLVNGSSTVYPMYIYYCDGVATNTGLIANNFVSAASVSGTATIYGLYPYSSNYQNIFSNSVNIYNTTGGRSMYIYSGGNLNIANNNLVNAGGGYAIYVSTAPSPWISDFNNLYTTGSSLSYLSSAQANLTAWRTASGKDFNSVSMDPLYFSNTNLHTNSFAFDNLGTPIVLITLDIDGQARNITTPDIGADEYTPSPLDGRLVEFTEPIGACSGITNVVVRLENAGTSAITSADIGWTIDGVPQTNFSFAGSLPSGQDTLLTIGTMNISLVTQDLVAYILSINGSPDPISMNDTTTLNNVVGGLSGTYTIGSTGDYASFAAAVADLTTFGVCGPVVFEALPGVYTEQFALGTIVGNNNVNTITFTSSTGDSADVILQFTSSTSANNFVVNLAGISYTTFEHMTLKNNGTTYSRVFTFSGSSNNTIQNCAIYGYLSTGSSDNTALIYSTSTVDSANVIRNNYIRGGAIGIRIYGTSAAYEAGNVIENNIISGYSYYGIYSYYQDNISIRNNTIAFDSAYCYTSQYALYSVYSGLNQRIIGNIISAGGTSSSYGIYLSSASANNSSRGIIANNFISIARGTTSNGLYLASGTYQDIVHNSVNVSSTTATTSRALYVASTNTDNKILNNSFYASNSGYAIYMTSLTGLTVNFNNLYSNGSLGYFGSAQASLNDWQSATGFDINSISVNPLYAAWNDLHTNSNDLNGKATAFAAVSSDIDGELRSGSPDIGADEFTPVGLDAAISWVSPTPPIAIGSYPITVRITNTRTVPIDSVSLTYSDGITTNTQIFNGLALTSNGSTDLTFTTPYSFSNYTSMKAYINWVNNVTDDDQQNDTTVTQTLCSPLAGVYTINPLLPSSSSNFQNFGSAVEALNCGGISAAVTFIASPGTYNEQIYLLPIAGSGPGNRVTFQSSTGIATDVKLVFSPTTTVENYIVKIDGASYLTFENMSFENNGTYSKVLDIVGNTDSLVFRNNIFEGQALSSTSTDNAVVYSSGFNNNNSIFDGNTILNGSYGLYIRGTASTDRELGNKLINNTIDGFYYYGIYSYYQRDLSIDGNEVTSQPTGSTYSTVYGIYTYYTDTLISLKNNKISLYGITANYGLYLSSTANSLSNPSAVVNNFISILSPASTSSTFYGVYFTSATNVNFANNSVRIQSGGSNTSKNLYLSSGLINLLNNNLVNEGHGYAIYVSTTSALGSSNFNNIYSNGTAIGYYSAAQATMMSWRTATSKDANSVSILPLFLGTNDLHILTPSLMGLGTPLAYVTNDIDGDIRDLVSPDIGADEFTPQLYDASIIKFDEPLAICPAGLNNVSVTLRNFGSIDLSNVIIGWEVDGVAQTAYNWAGLLAFDTETDSVLLGSYSFTPGIHYLKSWSEMPNGNVDLIPQNDTAFATIVACNGGLKGNYTIGSTGDYSTFTEAIFNMTQCGIDSVVIFDVLPGTYNEQIVVPYVNGMSYTNTVTFRSSTGVSSNVNVQFDANTTNPYVVKFDSAQYVSWENMTIKPLNLTYARGFEIGNKTTNISLLGNTIELPYTTASSASICGVYDNNTIDDSLRIIGNTILNGSYGMYIYGTSTSVRQMNTVISNNTFEGFGKYGIYGYYLENIDLSGNTFVSDSAGNTTSVYGLYLASLYNKNIISGNIISILAVQASYGIYVSSATSTVGNEAAINNNFISVRGDGTALSYGMYLSSVNYGTIAFNSINIYDTYATSRGLYVTSGSNISLLNNIIANTGGGLAVYFSSTTAVIASDYNNLYSSGSVLGYYSANQADLAAWQTASSKDVNSISTDPFFMSDTDLHVYLAAMDGTASTIVGITTDIDGELRNATSPDIGADEFTSMAIDVATLSITSPAIHFGAVSNTYQVTATLRNFGSTTLTSIPVVFSLDGSVQASESWTGSLSQGQTTTYTFTTLLTPVDGLADLKVYTTLSGDVHLTNDTATISFKGLPHLTPSYADSFETFDYFGTEAFEYGWELGTPISSTINSAYSPVNAWKTNLDGNYYNNAEYILYTPSFNFSSAYDAEIRFMQWYDTEVNDGGYVQYSNNNGTTWQDLGTLNDPNGVNWGTAAVNTNPGWSGSSGGWVYSSLTLSQFNGSPFPVQFRFVFYSDATLSDANGWAIDNFEIFVPTPALDAGVTNIISPAGVLTAGSSVPVTVTIKNFGTDTLNSIFVAAMPNTGQPPLNGTWTGTLLPDSSIDYTFPASYTPLAIASFEMCAFTNLTGEMNRNNDTTCVSLTTDVGINDPNAAGFVLMQNLPNPAFGNTEIPFYLPKAGKCILTINNIVGELVESVEIDGSAGLNVYPLDIQNLQQGVYSYTLHFEGVSQTRRLTVIK